MKRILFALALVALFGACKPHQPETPKIDVTGTWELESITTKVAIGGEQVSVYIDFESEGAFTLYQKIGAGRYTRFDGTWTIDQEAATLSGVYSGGDSWGPYSCTCSESTLVLTTASGGESDTYKRIDAIPAEVIQNVY